MESKTREVLQQDPQVARALKWVHTTSKALEMRLQQYKDTGNFQAVQELGELHGATLKMLHAGVLGGHQGYIDLLSDLEEGIPGNPDDSPIYPLSYFVDHGLQLDALATVVREAQTSADLTPKD